MPEPRGVNMRKALAGVELLKGKALKPALIAAGFSPATANNPNGNGLGVNRCIAEAEKLDPSLDPATLLAGARRAFQRKLEHLNGSMPAIRKTRPAEIARMTEVAEKFYGGGDGSVSDPRKFGDRMAWMLEVLDRVRELRGESPSNTPENSTRKLESEKR